MLRSLLASSIVAAVSVCPPAVAQQVQALVTSAGAGPADPLDGPGRPTPTPDGAVWVPALNDRLFRVAPGGGVSEVLEKWPPVDQPAGIAVAPDRHLYVTLHADDALLRADFEGGVEAVILPPGAVLDGPWELGFDALGALYVVNRWSDTVMRILPTGVATEVIGPGGAGPGQPLAQVRGLAIDGAGVVYVGGMASDNVLAATPGGAVSQVVGPEGDGTGHPLDGASAVAVSPDGTLWVASMFGGSVLRRTPDGEVTAVLTAAGVGPGDPLSLPNALALGPDGTLYVSSFGNDRVFAVAPGGAASVVLGPDGDGAGNACNDPTDLLVGPDGTLYVACKSSQNLFAVAGGTATHAADLPGFAGVLAAGDGALAFDPDGALLVSLWTGDEVVRVLPGGGTEPVIDDSGGPGADFGQPALSIADDQGRVYVACHDAVFRFDDASGGFEVVIHPQDAGQGAWFQQPGGLAFDLQGRLLVAGIATDNLLRLEADGSVVQLLGPADGIDAPTDLAVGADGTLYVANRGDVNVLAVAPDGAVTELVHWHDAHPGAGTTGAFAGWYDLDVDPLGRVYLGAYGLGEVHRLDPDGTLELLWKQPVDERVVDVAVDAGGAVWIGVSAVDDYVHFRAPSGALSTAVDHTGDGLGNGMRDPRHLVVTGPGRSLVGAQISDNVFAVDLGFCGGFVLLPGALAAAGDAPLLTGEGSLCAGEGLLLQLVDARAGAPGVLVVGASELGAPFKGGTLVPAPDLLLPLATDGAGAASLAGNWPAGLPGGLTLVLQAWIPEPAGPLPYSASNGLRLDLP